MLDATSTKPSLWLALLAALCLMAPAAADDGKADKGIGVAPVKAVDTLGLKRYAVIIGINDYRDTQIPDLDYAENDARALHALLIDPQVGGIEPKNAKLLLGSSASTRGIRKALADLRTLPEDATIFVFFSGHGAKEAGEAFWVTQDAELGELAATALSNFDVQRYFARVQTQRVITLLDCCYAAATVKEKSVVDLAEIMKQFIGKGRVTITASGSGEEAIEADDLKHGVFAHYLLAALRGAADGLNGPSDGIVTVPELTAYIDRHVAEAARQRKGIQKPNIFMEEVQDPGKFLVTVAPQRLAELAAEARRQSAQVRARMDALRSLAIEDKITVAQHALGKRLIRAELDALDAQDRERLRYFVELCDGKLDPQYLQRLLDSVETPAQRAARLERERIAALVTDTLGKLEGAVTTKDGTAAYQLLAELKKLSPSHPSIPDWSRRLEKLELPFVERDGELILNLGGGVKMELVLIPAGEFLMGSPEDEEDRDNDEGPQHRVRIARPFYMGKYEVTQAQWQAVMGENPSRFEDCGGDCPVEEVSWEDCQAFCRKLSTRTGREVRLPSEAEWEYACRAGTTTRFSFGDSDSLLARYAWFYNNSNSKTHAVGEKSPNAWGLYDMHGNVWEWCEDVWHDNYEGAPTDGSAWTSGGDQSRRVLRGGSWNYYARRFLRSAVRLWVTPGNRDNYSGLRVVVVASGTSP